MYISVQIAKKQWRLKTFKTAEVYDVTVDANQTVSGVLRSAIKELLIRLISVL